MPPQMPSALLRSAPSSNMFITIDSAAGSTIAAPIPWTPAHRDQERVGGREPAGERGGGEHAEPDHEHAAAPEQVGGAPAEQQEAAEGEAVGGDDPLQVRLREVELAADRRQRDVDDREVDDRHEVGHGQHREGAPAMHGRLHSRGFRYGGQSGHRFLLVAADVRSCRGPLGRSPKCGREECGTLGVLRLVAGHRREPSRSPGEQLRVAEGGVVGDQVLCECEHGQRLTRRSAPALSVSEHGIRRTRAARWR